MFVESAAETAHQYVSMLGGVSIRFAKGEHSTYVFALAFG